MSNDQYRAGAIGHSDAGGFGHGLHLPYQHLPNTEMRAIADPVAEGRTRAIEEAGAKRGYADYHEMLEEESLDVVSVGPRIPVEHEEMVAAAAEAKCHVYVEKPLARDLATADRIVETCDRNGVGLAVALQSRHVEPFRTARRMIRDGEIGELLELHARCKEDHRGGGEDLLTLGHHVLDLMRFVTGDDPEWVFGHVTVDGRDATRSDGTEPTEPVGPVAGDSVAGVFGFPGGVRGYVRTDENRQPDAEQYGITLVGSDGMVSIRYASLDAPMLCRAHSAVEAPADFEPLEVEREREIPGIDFAEHDGVIDRGNLRAVWDLLQSAEEGRDPVSSGRDARFVLEMIHGITASHLDGCRISLPRTERAHPLDSP